MLKFTCTNICRPNYQKFSRGYTQLPTNPLIRGREGAVEMGRDVVLETAVTVSSALDTGF
jgi:hypothetical protein